MEDAVINPIEACSELVEQVLKESDAHKTNDLIELFNWNMSKRNVARVHKLNNLFDDVTDQMLKRFKERPDQFSNDDLLNYMKTVQGALTSSEKSLEDIGAPPQIVQNNTQINVSVTDSFDRESRARILAAVQATLKAAQAPQVEYEDKTEGEISNESTDQ